MEHSTKSAQISLIANIPEELEVNWNKFNRVALFFNCTTDELMVMGDELYVFNADSTFVFNRNRHNMLFPSAEFAYSIVVLRNANGTLFESLKSDAKHNKELSSLNAMMLKLNQLDSITVCSSSLFVSTCKFTTLLHAPSYDPPVWKEAALPNNAGLDMTMSYCPARIDEYSTNKATVLLPAGFYLSTRSFGTPNLCNYNKHTIYDLCSHDHLLKELLEAKGTFAQSASLTSFNASTNCGFRYSSNLSARDAFTKMIDEKFWSKYVPSSATDKLAYMNILYNYKPPTTYIKVSPDRGKVKRATSPKSNVNKCYAMGGSCVLSEINTGVVGTNGLSASTAHEDQSVENSRELVELECDVENNVRQNPLRGLRIIVMYRNRDCAANTADDATTSAAADADQCQTSAQVHSYFRFTRTALSNRYRAKSFVNNDKKQYFTVCQNELYQVIAGGEAKDVPCDHVFSDISYSQSSKLQLNFGYVPDASQGNAVTVGVLLIRHEGSDAALAATDYLFRRMTKTAPHLTLTAEELDTVALLISQGVIELTDAVFYGAAMEPQDIELYNRLLTHSPHVELANILDTPVDCSVMSSVDFSLSRCTETESAFVLNDWRSTPVSPGAENLCNEALPTNMAQQLEHNEAEIASTSGATDRGGVCTTSTYEDARALGESSARKRSAEMVASTVEAKRRNVQEVVEAGQALARRAVAADHAIEDAQMSFEANIKELAFLNYKLDFEGLRQQNPRCYDELFADLPVAKQNEFRWLEVQFPVDSAASCLDTRIRDHGLAIALDMKLIKQTSILKLHKYVSIRSLVNDASGGSSTSMSAKMRISLKRKLTDHSVNPKRYSVMTNVYLNSEEAISDSADKARRYMNKMYGDDFINLSKAFSLVHWMSWSNIPLHKLSTTTSFVHNTFDKKFPANKPSTAIAYRMQQVLADSMRKDIVKLVCSDETLHVQIILDDTTSGTMKSMAVWFRLLIRARSTVDGQYVHQVVTKFYDLVHIQYSQMETKDAEQHLKELMSNVEKHSRQFDDTFEEKLKEKTIGLTADGASVNLKFFRLLMAKWEKKMHFTHCVSHRLQLVFGKAFTRLSAHTHILTIMKTVKQLFKGKIKLEFDRRLIDADYATNTIKQFKSPVTIRWLAHDRKATWPIVEYYPQILSTLKWAFDDASNVDVSQSLKVKCRSLYADLTSRSAFAYLLYYHDQLTLAEAFSLFSQKLNNHVADVAYKIRDVQTDMFLYHTKLTSFTYDPVDGSESELIGTITEHCTCNSEPCLSLNQFFSSETVNCFTHEMSGANPTEPMFDPAKINQNELNPDVTYSVSFFTSVHTVIEQEFARLFFNEHDNNFIERTRALDFAALLVAATTRDDEQSRRMARDSIKRHAQQFDVNGDQVAIQFDRLIDSIDMTIFAETNSNSMAMWLAILDAIAEKPEFQLLYNVAARLATVEQSSAEAERAFSLLFHVRSKRRMTMQHATLSNLMCIRLAKTPAEFDALFVSLQWFVDDKHLLKSQQKPVTWSRRPLMAENEQLEEQIDEYAEEEQEMLEDMQDDASRSDDGSDEEED